MYIEPNTNIRLLKNVPLDNTYTHTILFTDVNSQTNYFMGLQKYNLGNYSYQRVQRGVARVGLCADNIYDCNYMMFQNTNFGNKWFYAFITSVEYVNNVTAEIRFEIDVMQTWHFDYILEQSFIERQHTVTDVVGEHIEPEPVETGEMVFNDYSQLGAEDYSMYSLVTIVAVTIVDNKSNGRLVNSIYSGSRLFAFSELSVATGILNNMLDDYIEKPEAITGIYMVPKRAVPGTLSESASWQDHEISTDPSFLTGETVNLSRLAGTEGLDGYVPKNKKMYTYPYNYLQVDNANGSTINLRYEFFFNRTPSFKIASTLLQPVTTTCYPLNYKNTGTANFGSNSSLNTEVISITSYPKCSWNYDTFKAWVAQQAIPQIGAIGAGAITSGMLTLGEAGGAPVGSLASMYGLLAQAYKSAIAGDTLVGEVNTGTMACSMQRQRFYKGRMSVSHQYAKIIDDFFTMYGYNIKCIGVPGRAVRPHWTYVKTVGVNIVGSVPSDDLNKICRIYDHGITWWKNGTEIGNYSLSNAPA